jgi:hypothetical protein
MSRVTEGKDITQISNRTVIAIAHSIMEVGGGHNRFYYKAAQKSEAT